MTDRKIDIETKTDKEEKTECGCTSEENKACGCASEENKACGCDTAEEKECRCGNGEKSGCECKNEDSSESACKSEEAAKEEEDLNTRYLRLMADFQNFRRRTEKERSDIYAYANENFAVELLAVLDNFERALAAAPENDKFAEGMALIFKQFVEVLTSNKVSEIEAEGKPFDPNLHNAVLKQPSEGVESDVITQVLQKGYMLNGKVIRPSAVIVAE